MFNLDDADGPGRASTAWHPDVFARAYCWEEADTKGAFARVQERLDKGYSVLCFLPGNCMASAASVITRADGAVNSRGENSWKQYCRYTGKESITAMWAGAGDMVSRLVDWLENRPGGWPRAIFHNLASLSDERGGLHSHEAALTAFSALQEATRAGVVLGLTDRDAGNLPARLEALFPEHVRLDAIDEQHFGPIIPQSLGRVLAGVRERGGDGEVSDAAVWLIASRLRHSDPIRAVLLMDDVAGSLGDRLGGSSAAERLQKVLRALWDGTRTLNYQLPSAVAGGKAESTEKGFEPQTINLLRDQFIRPFGQFQEAGFLQADSGGDVVEIVRQTLKRLPPGLLLHGPAGTGKTHLVRWLAREMGLPLRVVAAAELRSGEWGVTERLVHGLFQEARRVAPSVLLFDEADDLFMDRSLMTGSVAGAERAIVNAALQEIDGVAGRPNGVLLVMTTNRFDSLDRAIRSRLGVQLHVPYPLTTDLIGIIVDNVAEDLGLNVSAVRERLVKRFFQSLSGRALSPIGKPDERRYTKEALFAPRDIQQAMRQLAAGDPDHAPGRDGKYPVGEADVKRMEDYYQQLYDVALAGPPPTLN